MLCNRCLFNQARSARAHYCEECLPLVQREARRAYMRRKLARPGEREAHNAYMRDWMRRKYWEDRQSGN